MRFHLSLALAASLGFVSGNTVDLEERAVDCGLKGNRILKAYFTTQQPSFTVPAQCGALCRSQILCQSYALEDNYCRLYSLPVISLVTKNLPGNNTFYDKKCATGTDVCQVNGDRSLLNRAFSTSTKLTDNSFKGCSELCKKTSGCQAFSIELATGGACRLYKNALVKDFTPNPKNTNIFWDVNCPRAVVNSGPALSFHPSASTVPSLPTEAAVTFPPAGTPTYLSTESPPYTPSGPQVPPEDDDDFISTYTYEEFALPTVDAMGSPPVTTGLPQPTAIPTAPCMVQPGSQAQFSVLNENFIPMVSRASNSIGPMLQPTAAPAANDPILDPENFELPGFYLQSAGASNVYDLVYAGSSGPQFVAMNTQGRIVLTGSSTGTTFKGNLVTTMFNADCFGVLSITQGGSSWSWTTNGAESRLVKGASKNMKALPKVIPAVQEARKHRRRNQALAERLVKRGYTDGPAPKCPREPANLVARTKQGYKRDAGNFCEDLNENWGFSPFSFDGSCAIQSLCYDQCEDMGWQSCNGIFGTSMILSCLSAFESWWEVIPAVACAAQASYFTGVAATSKGRELFYKAQESMCRCFCSSPPDTCVFKNGDFYCANTKGDDDSNCGNCGRTCGPNSKCRKGECGCPRDQCGTTCLDFRNNPKNCGACGNVCDTGYCLDGRCYKPVPGECTPDQAVTNSDFQLRNPNFVNWTMKAYPGSTLGQNVEFSFANYQANGASNPSLFVEFTNIQSGGRQAAVVQDKVKMCPGFKYELTFAMGYVNQVGDDSVTSNADCKVRWLTGTPDSWNNNDGYKSSEEYRIGVNSNAYKTFGPWTLTAAEGEKGVTRVKKDLFVSLTAVISCEGPNGGAGRFALRDVKMNPVGSAKARSLTLGDELADSTDARTWSLKTRQEEPRPYNPPDEVLSISFVPKEAKLRNRELGGW